MFSLGQGNNIQEAKLLKDRAIEEYRSANHEHTDSLLQLFARIQEADNAAEQARQAAQERAHSQVPPRRVLVLPPLRLLETSNLLVLHIADAYGSYTHVYCRFMRLVYS